LHTLTKYQFMLQYRPGVSHQNAHALSRCPCNRDSSLLMCKQCGPLLEPTDGGLEGKEADDEKKGLGYGL